MLYRPSYLINCHLFAIIYDSGGLIENSNLINKLYFRYKVYFVAGEFEIDTIKSFPFLF